MRRICPVCGREVDRLINGLCEECFRKSNPLVRDLPRIDRLTFRVCAICGSVLYKGRWTRRIDVIRKHISDLIKTRGVITRVEIGDIELEEGEQEVEVKICGKASEKLSEEYCETYRVYVKLVPDICPTCRSIAMGKERALIQVRYVGEKHTKEDLLLVRHIVSQVLAKSDEVQRGAVIDIEETGSGFDIKLTNNTIAKAIAAAIHRAFPSRIIESHKLIGMDRSGKPITRLTISIHVLNLKKGDIITLDGKDIYYVLAVSRNSIYLKNLETRENVRMSIGEILKKDIRKMSIETGYGKIVKEKDRTYVEYSGRVVDMGSRDLPEGSLIKVVILNNKIIPIDEEIIIVE
ncbi:MAG: hypothetical protein GXO10_05105 [Crenarchaeota archaeon]|nr:hypothetical protein [Thermoproteota archaeon]